MRHWPRHAPAVWDYLCPPPLNAAIQLVFISLLDVIFATWEKNRKGEKVLKTLLGLFLRTSPFLPFLSEIKHRLRSAWGLWHCEPGTCFSNPVLYLRGSSIHGAVVVHATCAHWALSNVQLNSHKNTHRTSNSCLQVTLNCMRSLAKRRSSPYINSHLHTEQSRPLSPSSWPAEQLAPLPQAQHRSGFNGLVKGLTLQISASRSAAPSAAGSALPHFPSLLSREKTLSIFNIKENSHPRSDNLFLLFVPILLYREMPECTAHPPIWGHCTPWKRIALAKPRARIMQLPSEKSGNPISSYWTSLEKSLCLYWFPSAEQ